MRHYSAYYKSKLSLPFPLTLSGCDLYLDSDNASNTNARWYDMSTNNWVIRQTNPALQPTLTANVLNGKNGYVFGGSTVLSGGDILDLHTGGYSMFVVYKETGNNYCIVAGKSDLSGTAGEYGLFSQDINTPWAGLQPVISAIGTYNQSNFQTASLILDRTGGGVLTNTLYFNGVQKAQLIHALVATDFNTTYDFTIGARHYGNFNFAGTICMIIRYNRALTSTEQVQVENYLRTKYGHY